MIALLAKNKVGSFHRWNLHKTTNQIHHFSTMGGMQFHDIIMGNEFRLKENFRGIAYSTSAFLVWKVLKKMFDKINGSQLLSIHREIGTLTQGDWCIYILHRAEATMG